jgi:hypothetical protein
MIQQPGRGGMHFIFWSGAQHLAGYTASLEIPVACDMP